jgi:hypothetical protein
MVALGSSADAQDLSAGKSPSQLFATDCSACHKSAQGLARGKDASSLASFLREHYTTKPQNAGALAGYLASVGGRAVDAPRQRPATATPPERTAVPASPDATTAARPRTVLPAGEGAAATRANPPAKPMTRAERMKLYSTSGDVSHPDDRPDAARQSEAPAARLNAYATSGGDVDAVGRDAAASSTGEPRERRVRAPESPAPVPEAPAVTAPDAPSLPSAAGPAPSSATPSSQPSEESR